MKKDLTTLALNQCVISKLNAAVIIGGRNNNSPIEDASDSPTYCQTCS
ncbi:hypothetical protein [Dokdonia sp.]